MCALLASKIRTVPNFPGAATIEVAAECRVRWGRGPVPATPVAGTFLAYVRYGDLLLWLKILGLLLLETTNMPLFLNNSLIAGITSS